jgi:nucleoside-diphosphate kinase
MVKPDGVQRGLIGEVIKRIENKGLKIIGIKMVQMDQDKAGQLYDIHKERDFYNDLKSFVTSGPVIVMAIEGENAMSIIRNLLGATKSFIAAPGTIRGDYGIITQNNIAHSSDSVERAKYEMGLFFKEDEIIDWDRNIDRWIY